LAAILEPHQLDVEALTVQNFPEDIAPGLRRSISDALPELLISHDPKICAP
jgi:hypothetical protein